MKVLIIGASGHTGSYLISALVKDGHEVVAVMQADISKEHMYHSPCCTVEKAKRLLGVEIKYSIMDIYYEYLTYQGM